MYLWLGGNCHLGTPGLPQGIDYKIPWFSPDFPEEQS